MSLNFLLLEDGDFIELEDNSGLILLEDSSSGTGSAFSFKDLVLNPVIDTTHGVVDGQLNV